MNTPNTPDLMATIDSVEAALRDALSFLFGPGMIVVIVVAVILAAICDRFGWTIKPLTAIRRHSDGE